MIYQFEHEEIKQCEYCKLCDLNFDWCNMQSCLIDKYESPEYNDCPLAAISKAETIEPCDYCNGDKPLTDKIYEDGTKFDDRQGTRIEKFGSKAMLVSYIRERYFDWPMFKNLDKKMLATRWAVPINYCPHCGRKLD